MAEFLTPRMPEDDGEPASTATGDARSAAPSEPRQVPLPPGRFGDPETPEGAHAVAAEPAPAAEPVAAPAPAAVAAPLTPPRSGPGSLWRLVSVIVSVGLAWAIVVATTAWLLGLFLTRG